jgi:hypothetical protein
MEVVVIRCGVAILAYLQVIANEPSMPRGCFDRWNAECKSAIVVLKTKNECVNVEGTMSCNAREEIGHLDLLEAGASREEAGEAGSTQVPRKGWPIATSGRGS